MEDIKAILGVTKEILLSNDLEYVEGHNYLSDYDVIIVEGFEMVGKSTLIEELVLNQSTTDLDRKVTVYRPDYDVLDIHLPRNQREIPGLVAIDLFKKTKRDGDLLILDRSFLSSHAYGSIYDKKSTNNLESILHSYLRTLDGLDALVIVVGVEDIQELKSRYYGSIRGRGEELDEYDKYESFSSYHKSYVEFTNHFLELSNNLRHTDVKFYYLDNKSTNTDEGVRDRLNEFYGRNLSSESVSKIVESVKTYYAESLSESYKSSRYELLDILNLLGIEV